MTGEGSKPAAEIGDRGTVVWQLDTSDDECWRNETWRDAINAFLVAHGIEPMGFLIGNTLTVRRYVDHDGSGTYRLDTWRAVGNDTRTAPLCENCPGCIKQEPVLLPLAAPVPLVGPCYVDGNPVLVVQPGDEPPEDGWACGPPLPATVVEGYRNLDGILPLAGPQA